MKDPRLPLHIVVASPLGAPVVDPEADACKVTLEPGDSLGKAFDLLRPAAMLGGVKFEPRALADLAPAGLTSAIGDVAVSTVLKDPAFLALESAWRGAARLVAAAEAPGDWPVRITLISAPASEVVAEATAALGELAESADARRPGLIVIDRAFGGSPGDAEALATLADWGAALSAVVLAQASPDVFGVRHAVHIPALADLDERMANLRSPGLQALRSRPSARWLSLVFGRWVTRSSYTEVDGFQERPTPQKPETMPFGHAVWLAAAGVARSYRLHGNAAEASGFFEGALQTGLGTASAPGAKKSDPLTSADVALEDALATAMLRAGVTPFLDRPQDGVGAFALLANFYRPAGPRLTAECSSSHQLFLGSTLDCVHRALEESRDPAAVQAALTSWLGAQTLRVGAELDPDSVRVEEAGGALEVSVHAPVDLDGKPAAIDVTIPLA